MSEKQKINDQPTENIVGDMTDSLMTGLFTTLMLQVMMGKSPSIKNVMSKNTLMDGLKTGGAILLYRRLGRSVVNNMMGRAGLGDTLAL